MKAGSETLREIPGYEGKYLASDTGRIWSLRKRVKSKYGYYVEGKALAQNDNGRGYLKVTLTKDGKQKSYYVHQLVAMAFLNHVPCNSSIHVDHIDDNPLNNNRANLQLLTPRENTTKRSRGSSQYVGVSWDKGTNKWRAMINVNGKRVNLGRYENEHDAAAAYQEKLATL